MIAQLGERQTEDLKVSCSIHDQGMLFVSVFFKKRAAATTTIKHQRGEPRVKMTPKGPGELVFINGYGMWEEEQHHWSNGQDFRLPSERSGFNSPMMHKPHQWFSGKISRCQRGAPGSIPGWCICFYLLYFRLDCQLIPTKSLWTRMVDMMYEPTAALWRSGSVMGP